MQSSVVLLDFPVIRRSAEYSVGAVSKTFRSYSDPIDNQDCTKLSYASHVRTGAAIAETLGTCFEILGNIVKGLAEWFSSLPGPIKELLSY